MTADSSRTEPTRALRVAGWLFGVLALAAVVGVAAHLGDIERFLGLMRSLAPEWLVFALLLQAATYWCVAATWKLGLRQAGVERPIRNLFPLALAKLFVDQTIPTGGMSGTAFLVAALARRGVAGSACMAALLVNLVGHYGAYLAAALVGIGLLFIEHKLQSWMVAVTAVFAVVSLAIPFAALALRQLGRREPPWLLRFPWVGPLLEAATDSPVTFLLRPRIVLAMTALGVAVILLDAATLWVMLHAMGLQTPYRVAYPSFLLAMMVAMLGPIPMGLGTFEAACVAALVLQGVPIEAALTATLLLRGCTTWLPMFPGLPLVRRELRASGGHH